MYIIYQQQSHTIGGLMEDEVYVFAVTATNQVGESVVNTSTMVQTNESSELNCFTGTYNCIVYISCIVPSTPIQNVMISNVTEGDNIAILVTWDPPGDPNGIIHYYRIEFEQILDSLDNDCRGKRNYSLDNSVMRIVINVTSGNSKAPVNITLSGLG